MEFTVLADDNPEDILVCTICCGNFNIETEGGSEGNIGILPVAFCPTCKTGIYDFCDQQMLVAFRSGYIHGVEMFAEHMPEEKHRDAEIATAFECFEEEQYT